MIADTLNLHKQYLRILSETYIGLYGSEALRRLRGTEIHDHRELGVIRSVDLYRADFIGTFRKIVVNADRHGHVLAFFR